VRIGDIEAHPGTRAFGYLPVRASRSGLCADIPLHVVAGVRPGPTLLVQAAVHGTEAVGTVAILWFLRTMTPTAISGTVIGVPVLNRVGFELDERTSRVDGKDLSRLFPGDPEGSLSDQIAGAYFDAVIRRAHVMIDLHAAAKGHERYVVFPEERDPATPTRIETIRRRLILAFGLDAAFFPADAFGTSRAEDAIASAGVVTLQPELGGGAGWFTRGDEVVADAGRGIRNVMRAMGMLDGPFEWPEPLCTVFNACVIFWRPPVDGLFIRRQSRGAELRKGAVYGTIQDPYDGRTLHELIIPRDAVVLPSGQEWPTMGPTTVGILGMVDRVVERRPEDVMVSFDDTR
jgi:predicted deacylase